MTQMARYCHHRCWWSDSSQHTLVYYTLCMLWPLLLLRMLLLPQVLWPVLWLLRPT